jgi:hypothetical protein
VGCDLPIECEYHQVAILRNAADMKGGGCACIDSVTATYFRSDAHDKFLVGDFYGSGLSIRMIFRSALLTNRWRNLLSGLAGEFRSWRARR